MMRILRKGERYVLNKPNENSYFLSSYIRQGIVLLTGLFCFQFVCFAQESRESGMTGIGEIKPLMVGQKVPEEFWTREHLFYVNGDTVKRTLEEYKGKLLLLDFWATWCISCIDGFPKLSQLQDNYSERFNVLLVNSIFSKDDYTRVHQIASDVLRVKNLHSIYSDSYFVEMFQFTMIPQYIWIDPKGTFIGMTLDNMVHNDQIEYLLNLYSKYEISN